MTAHTRKHLKQRALTHSEKAMLRLALEGRAAVLASGPLANEHAERVEADNYRHLAALVQRSQVIVKTTGEL